MKKMADIMSKTGKWLLVSGYVLSQLSFPLEVLAEELSNAENTNFVVEETYNTDVTNNTDEIVPEEDIQTEEVVIKINGEETLEYTTTSENTLVVISLEYQDGTEPITETINFSEKLYGIYQYTFEGIDKVVTINHIGNNIDLVEKNIVDVTKEITCNTEECIIKGFGSEVVTVVDINTYFNFMNFETKYNATTGITDGEQALIDTDTILNGHKLEIVGIEEEVLLSGKLVNTTPKSIYTFNRVGDVFVPSDGIVNEKDQKAILDDILLDNELTNSNDVNQDEKLNILDATHSTFIGEVAVDVTDILSNTLTSSSEEILLGETLEVKLFISGFNKALLYGIEGVLSYDDTILELAAATIYEPTTNEDEEATYLGYLNENKFAYILKNGFNLEDDAILTLEFEAIGVGETDITISDIIESYGEAFELENDNDNVSVKVSNPEDNKGGDEEDAPVEDDATKEEENEETEVVTKPVVRPVVLSSDYYLKSLTIDGYDIDFDMYTFNYKIKVANDVNSLNIKALLNNSNSIYYIEGNENFKEGQNLVYIIVKAQNGSTKTYTIEVEKEAKKEIEKDNDTELDEEVEEEEEKNTSKTIIIILIILVIIGLVYVIFKDDEEDTKETKKPVKSDKSNKVRIEEIKPEKVNTTKKTTTKKTTSNNKNTKKNNSKK